MMFARNLRLLNNFRLSVLQKSIKMHSISSTTENCVEVKIPFRWGHVAGKWWGAKHRRPILVLHGHQDNCGSFDRLLPELSSKFSFLAIDMPGHGYSSHLPIETLYNYLNDLLLIRQITDYFQWPKVSLMGHSMGSITGYRYTTCFPTRVDMLIGIDGLFSPTFPNYMERTENLIETYAKLGDPAKKPRCFTFEELEKKLHEATLGSIDLEFCKYILKRNISPSVKNPGMYFITTDPKLRGGPHIIEDSKELINSVDRVTCPVFVCITDGLFFYQKNEEAVNALKARPNVESHVVQGSHHLHLNTPEHLKKLLFSFLVKHDTIDRSVGGIKEEIIAAL